MGKMIEQERIESLVDLVESLDFPAMYEVLVDIGDVPFKENLKALRAIDIRNDEETGLESIERMLKGIDDMVFELEFYRDASEEIARRAIAVVRSA
jgi:hypothetical protein